MTTTYPSLETAAAEIRQAVAEHQTKSLDARRVDAPIVEIDRMLDDLEEMNLSGRRRVPISWEARLQRLLAAIPAQCRRDLRGNVAPNRLMDGLYDIQDQLLDLKIGPLRHELSESDAELTAAVA